MNPNEISQQFLNTYYELMSNNRAGLLNLYNDVSCMTYEEDSFKGIAQIKEKLESIGSTSIKYEFDKFDLQPGPLDGTLLIVVIGGLKMDNDPPFKFTQTFQLAPNGKGGYYIHNDILRLIYLS